MQDTIRRIYVRRIENGYVVEYAYTGTYPEKEEFCKDYKEVISLLERKEVDVNTVVSKE